MVVLIGTDVKEIAHQNGAPVIKLKDTAPEDHIKVYSSLHIVPGCLVVVLIGASVLDIAQIIGVPVKEMAIVVTQDVILEMQGARTI